MKIGIVGSRKRSFNKDGTVNKETKKEVEDLINSIDVDDTIVSGGCKGVDSFAIDYAIKRGMDTHVYPPFIYDTMTYGEMTQEYYRRNREVVDSCDKLYAFISKDMIKKGGTWYTVEYARKKGKPVVFK